jgi:hypothetical protein
MTTILIGSMPCLCHRLNFSDPSQQLQYTATVSMFVDDVSNGKKSFLDWLHEPPYLDELVEILRHGNASYGPPGGC